MNDLDQCHRDRADIDEVLMRYLYGGDRRDFALMRGCFTDDAIYEFHPQGGEVRGGDEIVAGIQAKQALPTAYAASLHTKGSCAIHVDGDTATADTFVTATQIKAPTDSGPVIVRGVRYVDTLARTAVGWRINRRQHHTLWQYSVPAMAPFLPKP